MCFYGIKVPVAILAKKVLYCVFSLVNNSCLRATPVYIIWWVISQVFWLLTIGSHLGPPFNTLKLFLFWHIYYMHPTCSSENLYKASKIIT